jgi:hypothetical protein
VVENGVGMRNNWPLLRDLSDLGLEAQHVIRMRLRRLAAGGARAEAECKRMVSEKFAAAIAAQAAAVAALTSGKRIDIATQRALAPVKRTVRANYRRLSRAQRFNDLRLNLLRLFLGQSRVPGFTQIFARARFFVSRSGRPMSRWARKLNVRV